jgi:uncharacterized spore protein YtfJ
MLVAVGLPILALGCGVTAGVCFEKSEEEKAEQGGGSED